MQVDKTVENDYTQTYNEPVATPSGPVHNIFILQVLRSQHVYKSHKKMNTSVWQHTLPS